MTVTIRMSEEEKKLATSYAKLHSMTVSEAFRRVFFEKIEDEYDAAVCEEALKEYYDSGCQARPIEELWKELGV